MAWILITGSCAQHGYRSNGIYVDGWFGGRCGSGHPFYLMCPDCRERYLEVRGNRENLQHSADVSDSQSSLRAPDLLDYIEQAYNGNVWLQHHGIINIWWKGGRGRQVYGLFRNNSVFRGNLGDICLQLVNIPWNHLHIEGPNSMDWIEIT